MCLVILTCLCSTCEPKNQPPPERVWSPKKAHRRKRVEEMGLIVSIQTISPDLGDQIQREVGKKIKCIFSFWVEPMAMRLIQFSMVHNTNH